LSWRPADGAVVAVVADKLWRGRRTGVGRTIEGLAGGLDALGVPSIVAGLREVRAARDGRYARPVREAWLPRQLGSALWSRNLGVPLESLVPDDVAVVHNTNIAASVRTRRPAVVTVHDLSPIELPDEYDPRVRRRFDRSVRTSADEGHVAFCVSAATADRLVDVFPAFAGRTVVGHLGPTFAGLTRTEPVGTASRILFVGELTGRKRPDLVVTAFERAQLPPQWTLTLLGNAGNAHDAVVEQARRSSVAGRIEVRLSVDDDELAGLYASSAFLVLPSRLEGFGVPVLDAVSAGMPAVVTSGSSLPEVAGPGGVVVPVDDVEALTDAIRRVASDASERAALGEAGRRHAQGFSWVAHAEAALSAYALASPSSA
jgi:glycosyltransferase involved in cell wall biosynthesis